MLRLAISAALAGVALAAPAQALAHASFVGSDPADGTVLTEAPREVRLRFDDAVQPVRIEAIRNGGASVLAGVSTRRSPRVIVAPLARNLPDGDYTVRWRALSDDGHLLQGVFAFAVGAGRAPPVATLAVGGSGPRVRELVARWLFLSGLLVAIGSIVFELGVARGTTSQTAALTAVGFALATVGSFGLVPHEGSAATRAERVYEIGAVISMTGVAAAAISLVEVRARTIAWLCALGLLPVPTLAGHALDRGHSRLLAVVADGLHIASAAVWAGGVLALLATLPRAADRESIARRFSKVALVSVATIAATGIARALGELSAIDQLWGTGYGRGVSIKSALLIVLAALGYANRARLVPRGSFGALRRVLTVESAVLAGIIVAAAFLTALPPGRTLARRVVPAPTGPPPAPPAGALVLAQSAGSYAVAIAATPRAASTALQVTVLGPDENGVETGVSVDGRELTTRCGPGCYATTLPARPTSIWVTLDRQPPLRFDFPKRWPPPPGSALADGAHQAYRALRSVVIDERLASGPEVTLSTRFRIATPNRLAYDIHGGSSAIVIGTHRWDRLEGETAWTESGVSPSTQPTPAWRKARNARLLAPDRVAFYDPTIPAWFDVRVDLLTARPVELHMIAPAHFMSHRYRAFDAAPPIVPPTR